MYVSPGSNYNIQSIKEQQHYSRTMNCFNNSNMSFDVQSNFQNHNNQNDELEYSFFPDEKELFKHENSIGKLLEQSKLWSKYSKSLYKYFEFRTQYEVDYYRNIIKAANIINFDSQSFQFYPFSSVFHKFGISEAENARKSLSSYEKFQKDINFFKSAIIQYDKEIKKCKDYWLQRSQKHQNAIDKIRKARANIYSTTVSQQNVICSGNKDKIERKFKNLNINEDNQNLDSAFESLKAEQPEKESIVLCIRNCFLNLVTGIKMCTLNYFDTLHISMPYDHNEVKSMIGQVSKIQNDMIQAYFLFVKEVVDKQPQIPTINNETELDLDSTLKNATPIKFHVDDNKIFKEQIQQSQIKSKENKIFGTSLLELSSNNVPDIVQKCVIQIQLRGQHSNGIYRVSGAKSKIDSLIKNYENHPNDINWEELPLNVLANVLKCYFRELPEPLLTFDLYDEFIKIANDYKNSPNNENNIEKIIGCLREVVSKMPKIHYNTLRYLMKHLQKISHHCAVNSMPPSNLGIIFGPTLLKSNLDRNGEISNSIYDTCYQTRIVELLIIYANEIFDMCSSVNE